MQIAWTSKDYWSLKENQIWISQIRNLVCVYVWEGARVWTHWNHSPDVCLSWLGQYPVFSYPGFPQGSPWGVAAVWWWLDGRFSFLPESPDLSSSPSVVAAFADGCDILCLLMWQEIVHFSIVMTDHQDRRCQVPGDYRAESWYYTVFLVRKNKLSCLRCCCFGFESLKDKWNSWLIELFEKKKWLYPQSKTIYHDENKYSKGSLWSNSQRDAAKNTYSSINDLCSLSSVWEQWSCGKVHVGERFKRVSGFTFF